MPKLVLMNFPKSTREIIYDIENYISKFDHDSCRNIVISVNNDEITGKDIKITSNQKVTCGKHRHQPYTLFEKIEFYVYMIFSMILTFGLALIFYAACDPCVGCIKISIKSKDRDLLEQLKLYFGYKKIVHPPKDFKRIKIKFFYVHEL